MDYHAIDCLNFALHYLPLHAAAFLCVARRQPVFLWSMNLLSIFAKKYSHQQVSRGQHNPLCFDQSVGLTRIAKSLMLWSPLGQFSSLLWSDNLDLLPHTTPNVQLLEILIMLSQIVVLYAFGFSQLLDAVFVWPISYPLFLLVCVHNLLFFQSVVCALFLHLFVYAGGIVRFQARNRAVLCGTHC